MVQQKNLNPAACHRVTPDGTSPDTRTLAAEKPLALTYNGISHVVMMVTPSDLEDFVTGFSLSEEIIETPKEISGLEIVPADKGYIAKIEIPKAKVEALLERGRHLVGQTGCGLCGVEDLKDAIRRYRPIQTRPAPRPGAIFKALKGLDKKQPLNRETGAVHAAAFVTWEGGIETVKEDVGRHNAFDKLIGVRARGNRAFSGGFALLTSRCSFELVQKALAVKIPMLVTISAPTDLAVELAAKHKLTLVALARPDAVLVMNDPFKVFG